MLKAKLAFIAKICTRHTWSVIAIAGLVAIVSGSYLTHHFAIDTDINKLLSPDLAWRQQELKFSRAFPQGVGTIFVVVDAPTAELEHFSIRLGVARVCEISFAFFFGNSFEKRGDCSPKFLNSSRLHFA